MLKALAKQKTTKADQSDHLFILKTPKAVIKLRIPINPK